MNNEIAVLIVSLIILSFIIVWILYFIFLYRIKISRYIKKYKEISNKKVQYKGKRYRAKNRGIVGEEKVETLIQKYTNVYYSNVVMPGKKDDFYSEMDYIIPVNNRFMLVEVKAWYGTISVNGENPNKVYVDFINHYNKHVIHERDNPFFTISFFRTDLGQYYAIKHNIDIRRGRIDRTIVFTRDECDFSSLKEDYKDRDINIFNLDEFDKCLSELKKQGAFDNQALKYTFPTWDKAYSSKLNKWFDTVLMNKNIAFNEKTLATRNIEALLLEDDIAIIKYRDSKIEKLHLDRETLRFNLTEGVKKSDIVFFYLNKPLHDI